MAAAQGVYEDPIPDTTLGFGLALHPSTPGWMMPAPHWHDCLEINYVRQGQGLYTIGEAVLPIGAGDMFVLPPGVPHRARSSTADPHWLLTIYIRPEGISALGDRAAQVLQETMGGVQQRHLTRGGEAWECLIGRLVSERNDPRHADRLMIAAELLEACLLVRRAPIVATGDDPLGHPSRPAVHRYVQAMCAFVEGHLHERLSLQGIASAVGLHPVYASTLFHRHTGKTLFQYVAERRMQRARALLASGELTVREVAAQCGYGSLAAFYRAYRRIHGMAPHGRPPGP